MNQISEIKNTLKNYDTEKSLHEKVLTQVLIKHPWHLITRVLLIVHSQHPSVSFVCFFWLSRKMACSQQEFSTHATTADLGRGDRVRRQSGGCAYAGERGPAGAQRGRVRH